MNKSHLGKANDPHPVVTAQDVGSFVSVAGVGKGILRYVGGISGKDGLFCGVEMESGRGKHDGRYQGVSYFECPPETGIFAPMYKVALDDDMDDVHMMSSSQVIEGREQLSRSALPALQFRSIFRPQEATPPISMTSSIYSDGTFNMDGSMFSQASWGDSMDMNASMATGVTYIIPPGKSQIDREECDLMAIEAPVSRIQVDRELLKREEARMREEKRTQDQALGVSFIVEDSRMGVELLPVVEDDMEDLETPLVEVKAPPTLPQPAPPIDQPQEQAGQATSNEQWDVVRVDPAVKAPRPLSPQSEDTGYNGESDASRASKEAESAQTVAKAAKKRVDKPMESEPPAPKVVKAKEAPPPPKFPVKPKAPSKHQLMMEQLKASIEAEKNRPKKEVKARVPLVPPPATVKAEGKDKDKMTGSPATAATTASSAPTSAPKRAVKQPKLAPPPPVERVKKERKPLYTPPPPKEKKDTVPVSSSKTATAVPVAKATATPRSVVAKDALNEPAASTSTKTVSNGKEKTGGTGTESARTTVTKTSRPSFPTSSFAGGKPRPSVTSSEIVQKGIDEKEKLARLRAASQAFEAMLVMLKTSESERARVEERLRQTETELEKHMKAQGELRNQLVEEHERTRRNTENVTRAHEDTVERLKERHDLQMDERAKEMERALDDERSRHEAETDAMNRRHQKVVASLDEKMAESEKLSEQLKADKKALQAALANDSDQRNQLLTKEIHSLQTALEMKGHEMKELRQKYQQVALRVEEIPVKELEITKLRHKVGELKQTLDQKISYEKILVHQNEELKRQTLLVEEEKDNMRRSMDVIRYKYEKGEEPTEMDIKYGGSTTSSQSSSLTGGATPGRVSFRCRSSTGHRPTSGIPPEARLSTSSYSDMDRSLDRDSLTRSTISMYASQYKLPDNHADDVIYAPDEIIMGGSNISYSEEEENVVLNGNVITEGGAHSDSGIVI